jgi:hypothetical protein
MFQGDPGDLLAAEHARDFAGAALGCETSDRCAGSAFGYLLGDPEMVVAELGDLR